MNTLTKPMGEERKEIRRRGPPKPGRAFIFNLLARLASSSRGGGILLRASLAEQREKKGEGCHAEGGGDARFSDLLNSSKERIRVLSKNEDGFSKGDRDGRFRRGSSERNFFTCLLRKKGEMRPDYDVQEGDFPKPFQSCTPKGPSRGEREDVSSLC